MSKSNVFETQLLEAIFENDVAGLGTLLAAGALATLYVSLHTSDPGEAGDQTTNEIAYTDYARVAITRATGFTVTGNSVSPVAAITFPEGGAGTSPTATHFGIGTLATTAGILMYSGTVTPNIVCGEGITPELTTATAITED